MNVYRPWGKVIIVWQTQGLVGLVLAKLITEQALLSSLSNCTGHICIQVLLNFHISFIDFATCQQIQQVEEQGNINKFDEIRDVLW